MKRLFWGVIVVLMCGMPTMAQDSDSGYQEALRRIEAARVSGATKLNFTYLGLKTLPREIGQLVNLEELSVTQIDNGTLQRLFQRACRLNALHFSQEIGPQGMF